MNLLQRPISYAVSIYLLSLYARLYSPCGPCPLFFVSLLVYTQSIGLLRREISPSQGRYLHAGQHKHNPRTQTSMHRLGFEPTIPVFEQGKTVHALDSAATVIDWLCCLGK
jgi:hypothetical protein